jgi:crotonobetainyl-CoA:carnitine CoA-transferase CaiB-like acyl-CoA transferase
MPIPVQTFLVTKKEEDDTPVEWPRRSLKHIYKTKDGYISLAALFHFCERFVKIIGREVPKVVESWEENMAITELTHDLIIDWFISKSNKEVDELLSKGGIPFSKVYRLSELMEDPQSMKRGIFTEVEHPLGFSYTSTSSPIKMSKTPLSIDIAPPLFSQDSENILSDILGYKPDKIAELKKNGAVL